MFKAAKTHRSSVCPPEPELPFDIVVVGSGVAGLSAAIAGSLSGLKVLVIERQSGPPDRPGETNHPGIEPLFRQFGILQAAQQAASGRPGGINFHDGHRLLSQPYGGTASTPWRGYHIAREQLHQILLQRARHLGACIKFNCAAQAVRQLQSGKVLVATGDGEFCCNWLFDATGPSNWLRRVDGAGYHNGSQQLTVCYGYKDTVDTVQNGSLVWPRLVLLPWGWRWDAPLGNGRTAWVKLFASRKFLRQYKPANCKSADATWRVSRLPAQNSMFRIGDAALRLDPSSGKGVLRAMMSAIMAVHLVRSVKDKKVDRGTAESQYSRWITKWFDSDTSELRQLLKAHCVSEN